MNRVIEKETVRSSQIHKEQEQVNEAGKKEFEKAVKYATYFAKSVSSPLWNVDDLSSKQNPTYTRYTKENILSYMQAPSSNEKMLRNASIYMYDASSQYRRLIQYYALLLKWPYIISALDVDMSKVREEAFKKQYQKVSSYLEIRNLQHELQKAVTIALRDGILYGAIWQSNNSFYVQRINPDYCALTAISDGTWIYSVDMSQIQESKLNLYPPEFTTMYKAYKNGGNKYQEVPESISFCLKADEANTAYSIPPWSSTLPMLYDLETYKALQETATRIANYKMLSMKIDLNSDGSPVIDWELAKSYYKQLCNALPPYVGATISPMKIDSFNFEKSNGTQEVDTVSRAENQFWFDTGTSALLHGSNVSNTAGALKLSIKSDEELMFGIMSQAERLINRMLKSMPGTIKFKIQFLPVTIFNIEEQIKYWKEAASLGVPGSKIAYAAVLGVHQASLPSFSYIENNILQTDTWVPLQSGYTVGSQAASAGGRPLETDLQITDAGEKTREAGSNDNR